jgi:hypothetical protein
MVQPPACKKTLLMGPKKVTVEQTNQSQTQLESIPQNMNQAN